MNKENIEEKIKEITKKIVKEYQPEKIILFGSVAWGEPSRVQTATLIYLW